MSIAPRRSVFVDTRWEGTHGIGRYAREVTSRFRLDWTRLDVVGSPSSPREALTRHPQDARAQVVYSPGYNVSRLTGAVQIITVHDLIHLQVGGAKGSLYRAYYDAVVRPVIRRTGVVLTVSETSAQAIRKWIGDASVDVVNAGIGLSEAFSVTGSTFAGRRPYFMYVGNLRAHKNVDVILRALRGLNADVTMLLPLADADGARRMAEELGVAAQVRIVHGLDDGELASLYRGAAATFMPSLIEGFGLPALESISVGTPVLYWQGCSSVAEIVGDRGVAMRDPHDTREWASAARNMAASPGRVEPPSAGSYDWDRTAERVQMTIDGLRDA